MTLTFDREALAAFRKELHRAGARVAFAANLADRGLHDECGRELAKAAALIDDLGSSVDDTIDALELQDAVAQLPGMFAAVLDKPPAPDEPPPPEPLAPPKPPVLPPVGKRRRRAPTPPTHEVAALDGVDTANSATPAPATVDDDDDEAETETDAPVPGGVTVGKWTVKTGSRGRHFVRCPVFTCSKRVYLDDDSWQVEADIEHAVFAHKLAGACKAPPATRQ